MNRKRLTREESRELTSQRLVDAAQRLIARRGLEAASVEDIADAAGYSRGAFYSNFKTKSDLFYEVLRQDQHRNNAKFAVALDDALPLEQILDRFREVNAGLFNERDSFMAWTEARLLSARDPKFRVKVAGLIAERRDFVASIIGYLAKRMGATPSLPLEVLAMGFISLSEGVRLFGASCADEMTAATAGSIFDVFLESILQNAVQAKPRGSKAPRGSAKRATV